MFRDLWRTRGLGRVAPHRARRAQQPPAGRTTPATVYKCALVNKGTYGLSPDFGSFAASSAAPGRWDRAIRNALTSMPGRPGARGNTPSKMAPRSIRRRVRALRSSLRCLFSKIFWRFSSCRISFRTSSRSSFFCFAWAVLSLCISLSPLAAPSSRA